MPATLHRPGSRFPGLVLPFAVLVGGLPFVVIMWAVWDLSRTVPAARERSSAVQELVGRIDYLDEALTSTARLTALTGETRWEERYLGLEEQVFAAIDSVNRLGPAIGRPGLGDSILAVADSLVAMEHRVLEMARRDSLAAAWALLETPAYASEKASYLRHRDALLAELRRWAETTEERIEGRLLGIVVLAAGGLATVLLVWGGATYLVRRHMARREGAEADLRQRVAEQHRLEADLRKAEARLRAVVDVAPVAIIRVDNDRSVQFWNPAAERMFGWSADEVLGEPYPLVAPNGEDEVDSLFERGYGGETLDGVEVRRLRKDGTEVPVRVWNAMIREGSEVRGLVGILADVTEQRALEHQLRQAQKLEAVGRLAGGIAHDFNNILTAVRSHAQLLLDEADPEAPFSEGLEQIGRSAERASRLTRQLLAFSRQQVLQPRALDLAEVVKDLEPLLRRLIGEHIRLELDIAEQPPSVEADPTQIEQVLVNLAVNARDAMPAGGRLVFSVHPCDVGEGMSRRRSEPVPPGRYVRLLVSDTGKGMDEETIPRIFEPFFTTKAMGQGTGLGLATVFGIVKQSGGYLSVESAPGAGSEFEVLLPVVEAAPVPLRKRAVGGEGARGRDEKILVVEDDRAVRRVACSVLEKAGYRVVSAASPKEAMRIAEECAETIDLLLTDVVLPEMSGAELAARLNEGPARMRTVFMSGYTQDEVLREGLGTGPSVFLQKPFGPRELEKVIREVLDRG